MSGNSTPPSLWAFITVLVALIGAGATIIAARLGKTPQNPPVSSSPTQGGNSERDKPQTLPTTQASTPETKPSISAPQRQLTLDLSGEWGGKLVGTSGTLNYNFLLYQSDSQIEGTARAVDPVNSQRYVVFKMRGAVSGRNLEFEQYEIAESNPPTDWCLIAGTLSYMNSPTGEFLQGNFSTRSVNVNPACSGIVGQLNLQKR